MKTPERIVERLRGLLVCLNLDRPPAVWLGFSGGLDSTVLLHVFARVRDELPWSIGAIHVDHGLSRHSAQWAAQCRQIATDLDVPFRSLQLEGQPPAGMSVEAWARDQRYRGIAETIGTDAILVTAHHQRDQAETFLLRALRGSGVTGLAAMRPIDQVAGLTVVRPLLGIPREQLESYAHRERLQYCDDPANENLRFDRTFLRQQIMPLLRARWPAIDSVLERVTLHQHATDELLRTFAQERLLRIAVGYRLDLTALLQESQPMQALLVREWIKSMGADMPSSAVLTEILDVVARADIDAQPVLRWAGGEVRRFRRELHFIHTPIPLSAGAGELDWHPAAEQALSLPYGMLSAIPVRGAGIPQRLVPPAGLIVRFRRGGERCQPLGRRHSQTLKHALQDSAVPPWERRLIPLIYNGETLLAAGDAFVTDDSRCAADEDGWLPRWSR